MARKPKQDRAKLTRDAVIESGYISIKNNGLGGTTTTKIAALAGVSVGSVYEYFPDKDAIYEAMVQVFVDENIAMLKDAMTDILRLPIGAVIRLLLYRYKDILEANDGRYLVIFELQNRINADKYVAQAESVLMDIIMKYAMHNPHYLKIDNLLTLCYIGINGAVFSIVRYLNQPTAHIDFDTMVDVFASMIENHISVELSE